MYYAPKPPPQRAEAPVELDPPHGRVNSPIVLRDRRLIGRNEVFSVYFDRLEQPDGRQVVDYLSVLPKTWHKDGTSGVAVLPECDGKFGLIHIYRHPLGVAAWEIPRGFVDAQESAPEAALRELKEETGMEAAVSSLVDWGALTPEPGLITARVRIYWAPQCMRGSVNGARELGHGALRFFTPEEIAGLIAANEIQDPCTLVACLRHARIAVSMAAMK